MQLTRFCLIVAAAVSAAAAATPTSSITTTTAVNRNNKRVLAKRGALPSWEQLALLSSYNPYSALIGSSPFHAADSLGLASSQNLDLYNLNNLGGSFGANLGGGYGGALGGGYGGGPYYGGGVSPYGGGASSYGGGSPFGGVGSHYGGLGLLNVAAAAPVGYNPYFAARSPVSSYRNLLEKPAASPYSTIATPTSSPTPASVTPSSSNSVLDKAVNTFANTAIYSTPSPLKTYNPSYEPTKLSIFSASPVDFNGNNKYQSAGQQSLYSIGGSSSPLDVASGSNKYQSAGHQSLYSIGGSSSPLDVASGSNKYQSSASLYTSVSSTPSPLDFVPSSKLHHHSSHNGMTAAYLPVVSTTVAPHLNEAEVKLSATYSASPTASTAARYNSGGVPASHPAFGVYGTAFPPSYRSHYSHF
jgi:hypothetical protein